MRPILPLLSLALPAAHLAVALPQQYLPVPPLPSLEDVKRSFNKSHIVPDVIDHFEPVAQVFLEWERDMLVLPGKRVNKSDCSTPPTLSATDLPSPGPFLILTVDPDAPSPKDPKNSPFRHFLQTNLYVKEEESDELPYADKLVNRSEARSGWYPPAPPPGSGPHRYITLLYAQPSDLDLSFVDWDERKKFDVRRFVRKAGLGEVLAGNWFVVEVEDEDDTDEDEIQEDLEMVRDAGGEQLVLGEL